MTQKLNIIGQGALSAKKGSEAPKIEFPCEDYPIKVMGDASKEMHALVIEVMERHAPGFDQSTIAVRQSSKGRYQSLTVNITATGVEQLTALHEELKASDLIKIVL